MQKDFDQRTQLKWKGKFWVIFVQSTILLGHQVKMHFIKSGLFLFLSIFALCWVCWIPEQKPEAEMFFLIWKPLAVLLLQVTVGLEQRNLIFEMSSLGQKQCQSGLQPSTWSQNSFMNEEFQFLSPLVILEKI